MNKKEIKELITKFKAAVESETAEINIMLVDQNNQRKKRYKGLMLKTQSADVQDVVIQSLEFVESELDRRSLDKYDLEISLDESTQVVEECDVVFGKEILEDLTVDYTENNVVSETSDLNKMKFIVYQIYELESQTSMYLYAKYIQPNTAFRTSQKYIFSGGVLRPFVDEVITLSSAIDAVLLGEKYLVFNRNAFNSIFSYKDVYKKILEDNTPKIIDSGLLTNSDKFISDCEADGRYLTRLTKAILAKGFEEVTAKRTQVKQIAEDYNLSLDISENGEIIYKGKEDIPEVLNLLLRHYVIDALTSNKMIASAIQEYEAGMKR